MKRGQPHPIRGELCPWSKLTEASVKKIRRSSESCVVTLAQRFGVCSTTIHKARRYASWKHVDNAGPLKT